MKVFGLLLLLLLISMAAIVYLGCASKESIATNPGYILIDSRKAMVVSVKNRKLKEEKKNNRDEAEKLGQMHLEDYRPIDPVPSSKASIKHGPISHGTPLLPFVPKTPPPPSQPKHVGLP